MQNIQDVFSRLVGKRLEQRKLRKIYRETLKSSPEYQEVMAEIDGFREKKKRIEEKVQVQFSSELNKIAELESDMKLDKELLNDSVLTKLAKGEIVKVRDTYNNTYDPIMTVRFKKSDEQEQ
ncbi:MAG: hypothetical protein Q7R79_04210 [bacterium]|nr:hypothetical protein [bacterium]